MAARITSEFDLAAACCRWPYSPAQDQAVRGSLAAGMNRGGIDWARFMRIVQRHRIEGLVHGALRPLAAEVPEQVMSNLAAASAGIAQENLLHAAASLRLQSAFSQAGIPLLFVKGATLSILAYGTLALKKSRDIDIVIPRQALGQAFELLRQAGYRCLTPLGEPADGEAERWAELSKETVWRDASGILVELHSGLVDNPLLLPGIGLTSPLQRVEIARGKTLPTLQKDELFSYLCVHGAAHAWSRLKWLADVAALIAADGPEEVERLFRRSIELGAGRSSAQALLLCARLLGTLLPPHLIRELESDAAVRWLARVAMRSMAEEKELDETVLGTVPIHVSHFLIKKGGRYKLSELRRKSSGRPTPGAPSLPRSLKFLQPLVAIPLWLRARARERIRR